MSDDPKVFAGFTITEISRVRRVMEEYDIPDIDALEAILRRERRLDERTHFEWLKDRMEAVFGEVLSHD